MFYKDNEGYYRSTLLDAQSWLHHGFATRECAPWPRSVTTVKQIHSALVLVADNQTGIIGEADALITQDPKAIGIKTADCLPILIADPVTKSIAAVHAGWRGVAAKILPVAIAAMQEMYGSSPRHLQVAVGPGIARCCFEVGPEVAQQFGREGKQQHIDLYDVVAKQLEDCSVPEGNTDLARQCTKHNTEFHSYRRDKDLSGRMLSIIEKLL